MKKYLVFSFLIHTLLVALTMLKLGQISEEKREQEKQQQGQKKQGRIAEIQVIERIPSVTVKETPKKEERFYWGIGISIDSAFVQIPGMVAPVKSIKIEKVYIGYCAESAGLLANDLIVAIDDDYLSDKNDIVGIGPRKMVLTIVRNNGIVLKVPIERCKVFY